MGWASRLKQDHQPLTTGVVVETGNKPYISLGAVVVDDDAPIEHFAKLALNLCKLNTSPQQLKFFRDTEHLGDYAPGAGVTPLFEIHEFDLSLTEEILVSKAECVCLFYVAGYRTDGLGYAYFSVWGRDSERFADELHHGKVTLHEGVRLIKQGAGQPAEADVDFMMRHYQFFPNTTCVHIFTD